MRTLEGVSLLFRRKDKRGKKGGSREKNRRGNIPGHELASNKFSATVTNRATVVHLKTTNGRIVSEMSLILSNLSFRIGGGITGPEGPVMLGLGWLHHDDSTINNRK